MAIDSPTSADPAKRPFAPTDLYRLRSVSDVALHPDGRIAVMVIGWPDQETDSNRANLYRVDLDGNNYYRLTEGHRDSGPRFSPDGTKLAFSRSEPGKPGKLMILDWPVGDVRLVAEFADGGPGDVLWLDNRRLLMTAPQRPRGQHGVEDDELARRPKIITSFTYRFNGAGYIHDRPGQIWLVDLDRPLAQDGDEPATDPGAHDGTDNGGSTKPDRRAIPLGAMGVRHSAYAVSPDGRTMVAVADLGDDNAMHGTNHLIRYDLDVDGGDVKAAEPVTLTLQPGSWSTLLWHPDGSLLAFGSAKTDTIEFERMFVVDPRQPGEPIQVAFDDISISAGSSTVRPVDSGVLAAGSRRGRVAIDRYTTVGGTDEQGGRRVVYEDDSTVLAFDSVDDGTTVVAAITTTRRPAELWRITDGQATRIVSLNDEVLDEIDLAVTESVEVTSADGTRMEAFITRPPLSAPDTGSPRPGLVYVHGGPMFQYGHFFFDEFQVAAAAGYVVIGGNPRGSDGYGQDWAQDIIENYGNRDWQDVQAITVFLADQPDVDADRIGIGGGSYGGFMTSWALGHDDEGRYKAGLVERAVTDFVSFSGTSDIGHFFVLRYLGTTIEGDVESIRQQSPLTFAHNITAPTLILHSEEDWRCPIEQAERLYVAIRRNGGSAALVRFPGENHELSRSGKPRHRVERFEIIHEFYARHLGGADFNTSHLSPAD
ncbi:MAG: S9 family peptidase [Acidimicrobiia bacterium]|nr:S9 family peptidase [Acidimicrobiia bacterium]